MSSKVKVYLIAGARPNFMNIAPLIKEFQKENIKFKLIHTGQHLDYNMSKVFFNDLGIPGPDVHLDVGSASHAIQTAKIMIEFEKVKKLLLLFRIIKKLYRKNGFTGLTKFDKFK